MMYNLLSIYAGRLIGRRGARVHEVQLRQTRNPKNAKQPDVDSRVYDNRNETSNTDNNAD